ncbi:MAG: DEAD/DEAH box helicase [Treponemataceae bacterium]
MENLVEIGKQLKEKYLNYIDTSIPLPCAGYQDERRALYEQEGVIMQSPIIEFIKKYEPLKTLNDVCVENKLDPSIAEFLNLGLLKNDDGSERKLYKHQIDSVVEVLANKKNLIVTTGTGSGKTECFMIPLIANLIHEAKTWEKREDINRNDNRSRAVRAMILYPLNALVEDQMIRLRKTLGSADVKNWLDKNCKNNRIFFGRYTGRTERSREAGHKYERNWKALKNELENSSDERIKELTYLIPCTDDPAEMLFRDSMIETPPDILITNYSMLNIMTMRSQEEGVFEKTRNWLEEDESHVFTLVIDELHSYRGTAGTEVAYMIKVLIDRLGLQNKPKQIRFLCSSASLSVSKENEKFIEDFFGCPYENFVHIYDDKEIIASIDKPFPTEICQQITELFPLSENKISEIEQILKTQGFNSISDFVMRENIIDRVKSIVNTETSHAKTVSYIAEKLFPEKSNKLNLTEAVLFLINNTKEANGSFAHPMRVHYFARHIDKLWICSSPDCNQVDEKFKSSKRKFGKLYATPQNRCACGAKIFEVVVCRQCGEIYLAGYEENYILSNNPRHYLIIRENQIK